MTPSCSILISSRDRLPLFRRVLWNLSRRHPSIPFELVIADDGSTEDVLGEVRRYNSFPWTFVRVDMSLFEKQAGVKKFFNSPSLTNNCAFAHARGDKIFLQGNEVIPVGDAYDRLLDDAPGSPYFLVVSTTYDLDRAGVLALDEYGTTVERLVESCRHRPLQDKSYRSDVTNYLSLTSRATWEALGGYDERYLAGISADDSCWVRRARVLPGFEMVVSEAVSIHQDHGGWNLYRGARPTTISRDRQLEGQSINRAIFDSWDGTPRNPQPWPPGTYGVVEVIRNWS